MALIVSKAPMVAGLMKASLFFIEYNYTYGQEGKSRGPEILMVASCITPLNHLAMEEGW